MSTPPPVASPCIGVCMIDADSERCHGCLRTLDEIAAWGGLSDAERAAIMDTLPQRRRDAEREYDDD